MHLLRAVERVGGMMENEPYWRRRATEEAGAVSAKDIRLPNPVLYLPDNSGSMPSPMHGFPLMM